MSELSYNLDEYKSISKARCISTGIGLVSGLLGLTLFYFQGSGYTILFLVSIVSFCTRFFVFHTSPSERRNRTSFGNQVFGDEYGYKIYVPNGIYDSCNFIGYKVYGKFYHCDPRDDMGRISEHVRHMNYDHEVSINAYEIDIVSDTRIGQNSYFDPYVYFSDIYCIRGSFKFARFGSKAPVVCEEYLHMVDCEGGLIESPHGEVYLSNSYPSNKELICRMLSLDEGIDYLMALYDKGLRSIVVKDGILLSETSFPGGKYEISSDGKLSLIERDKHSLFPFIGDFSKVGEDLSNLCLEASVIKKRISENKVKIEEADTLKGSILEDVARLEMIKDKISGVSKGYQKIEKKVYKRIE